MVWDEPERRREEKFQAFVKDACIVFADAGDTTLLRGQFVEMLVSVLEAHRRGVPIYPGTDYGCFYGPSLHWELEFLTQAGLSTLDVLRSATKAAAEAVRAEDDLGTLKPGKLADIVLLDANPLDDIRNTQKIWRVIKGGLLFDPDQLREQQAKN